MTGTSGRRPESHADAASPSAASATSYPSRTSIARSTRRRFRSSSATRMVAFIRSSLRQLHRETAPLSSHGLERDGSAVFLDNPPADRQPHPHTAFPRGEEGAEEVLPVRFPDPRPGSTSSAL